MIRTDAPRCPRVTDRSTARRVAAAARTHRRARRIDVRGEFARALPPAVLRQADAEPAVARPPRAIYLALLTWAFTLFNSVRVIAYLPTMWAIQVSGDSTQHSLWTWLTWFAANVTMAAWLYEQNGKRFDRTIAVNIGNASMCLVTVALIVAHRF